MKLMTVAITTRRSFVLVSKLCRCLIVTRYSPRLAGFLLFFSFDNQPFQNLRMKSKNETKRRVLCLSKASISGV